METERLKNIMKLIQNIIFTTLFVSLIFWCSSSGVKSPFFMVSLLKIMLKLSLLCQRLFSPYLVVFVILQSAFSTLHFFSYRQAVDIVFALFAPIVILSLFVAVKTYISCNRHFQQKRVLWMSYLKNIKRSSSYEYFSMISSYFAFRELKAVFDS